MSEVTNFHRMMPNKIITSEERKASHMYTHFDDYVGILHWQNFMNTSRNVLHKSRKTLTKRIELQKFEQSKKRSSECFAKSPSTGQEVDNMIHKIEYMKTISEPGTQLVSDSIELVQKDSYYIKRYKPKFKNSNTEQILMDNIEIYDSGTCVSRSETENPQRIRIRDNRKRNRRISREINSSKIGGMMI